MDGAPQEKLCVFKHILECSITCELSEDCLSEARKEKVVQCSIRRNDNLHAGLDLSSIHYHKNCYLTYTSNDHINRYLKRTHSEEAGTSDVKRSRRLSTEKFDFKQNCIICGKYCNVIKDKKHPDRWKKNKGFLCRTADRGKGKLSFKETLLKVNDNVQALSRVTFLIQI